MSPVLFFYLCDIIENTGFPLLITGVFLFPILGLMTWMGKHGNKTDMDREAINDVGQHVKYVVIGMISLMVIAILIPRKETMYLMAASSVVMDVASNERVKSIADNSLQLIEEKIKEYAQQKKETK
jgi:hypothetical protein